MAKIMERCLINITQVKSYIIMMIMQIYIFKLNIRVDG